MSCLAWTRGSVPRAPRYQHHIHPATLYNPVVLPCRSSSGVVDEPYPTAYMEKAFCMDRHGLACSGDISTPYLEVYHNHQLWVVHAHTRATRHVERVPSHDTHVGCVPDTRHAHDTRHLFYSLFYTGGGTPPHPHINHQNIHQRYILRSTKEDLYISRDLVLLI